MKINVTLCRNDYQKNGNIPQFKFKEFSNDIQKLVNDHFEIIPLSTFMTDKPYLHFTKYVYVLFQNYRNTEFKVKYNEEINTMIVTNDLNKMVNCIKNIEEEIKHFQKDYSNKTFDYAIFEFETFEDAFGYLKDLKEGL
jgi:hypothetical protein